MKAKLGNINIILTALTIVLFITPALGFWRHLCHGQLGLGRVDPLMSPDKPSQHVHNIQGASNFGFSASVEELMTSNCTSCSINQDKSVYWSPQLYFQYDNGTFELVTTAGGLTVYYFTESPKGGEVHVQAFPRGFRMIAGMSTKRKFFGPVPDPLMAEWKDSDMTQQSLMEKSIGFNCLNYQAPAEGSMQYHELRNKSHLDAYCIDGIRAELQFPSCWNGNETDSHNHTAHVAYPYQLRDGDCPPAFDFRLPTLFYETIYNTNTFKDYKGQFVFAQGDPTGNGYHGDFINGWEDGVLQQAIDTCSNGAGTGLQEDCHVFDIKPDSEVVNCKMETPESLQNEQINFVEELPGGCQIQSGVDFATMPGMPMVTPSTPSSVATETPQYTAASNTSTFTNAMPSSTTSLRQFPNTTSAATPPDTTPAPTAGDNEVTTYTSVTTVDGTVMHYVIVEEIITTTVVVDGAGPSPGPTPVEPVKRHGHAHKPPSHKSTGHGHGISSIKNKRKRG